MRPHADILEALPHRPPFRFVSRVDELEPGRSGSGAWVISGREDVFAGHFPGRPIVPGVLLGEALAQLAGLVGLHAEVAGVGKGGRLAHVDLRFDRAVEPPAEVTLHASVVRSMLRLIQFDVRAEHQGRVVARGTLTLASASEPVGGEGGA
jgi:3-hydroxyacyl-[acyl-carrier-protein] dehydratase